MKWQLTYKQDPPLNQIVEAWDKIPLVARIVQRWDCREDEGDCDHEDCECEEIWQYYIGQNQLGESDWMDWKELGSEEYPAFWRELILPPGQVVE